MQDNRLISRISVEGFKIQFKVDGSIEPFNRKVEDISFKGLSFSKIKKDYLEINKEYEFVLCRGNKYILGKAYLVYESENKYGISFQHIDNDHYKLLCDFLDPVYAGLNLELVKDLRLKNLIELKYQSLKSGLVLYYKKFDEDEVFEFSFIDKFISYNKEDGIKVGLASDYKGELTLISQKNSIYNEIISNFQSILDVACLDLSIKDRIKSLIC